MFQRIESFRLQRKLSGKVRSDFPFHGRYGPKQHDLWLFYLALHLQTLPEDQRYSSGHLWSAPITESIGSNRVSLWQWWSKESGTAAWLIPHHHVFHWPCWAYHLWFWTRRSSQYNLRSSHSLQYADGQSCSQGSEGSLPCGDSVAYQAGIGSSWSTNGNIVIVRLKRWLIACRTLVTKVPDGTKRKRYSEQII